MRNCVSAVRLCGTEWCTLHHKAVLYPLLDDWSRKQRETANTVGKHKGNICSQDTDSCVWVWPSLPPDQHIRPASNVRVRESKLTLRSRGWSRGYNQYLAGGSICGHWTMDMPEIAIVLGLSLHRIGIQWKTHIWGRHGTYISILHSAND